MFYFDNETLIDYLETYQRLMVYVNKEYITITNIGDISDTEFGAGIDVTGKTISFSYKEIEMVKIGSTIFTLDMLQKSKEPKDQEPEKDTEKEATPKEDDKKQKESIEYNNFIKNIDRSSRHYGTTGAVQLVSENIVTYKTYVDGDYRNITVPLKFVEKMEIIEFKG